MASLRVLKRCRDVCELPLKIGLNRALEIEKRVNPFGRQLDALMLLACRSGSSKESS
jgi:hypothetical protein